MVAFHFYYNGLFIVKIRKNHILKIYFKNFISNTEINYFFMLVITNIYFKISINYMAWYLQETSLIVLLNHNLRQYCLIRFEHETLRLFPHILFKFGINK